MAHRVKRAALLKAVRVKHRAPDLRNLKKKNQMHPYREDQAY